MKDLDDALKQLDSNIDGLDDSITWAVKEIRRLRAENMEQQLKIDNLLYMLKQVTQGSESPRTKVTQ